MSSSELLTDAYLIDLLQRDAQRKPTRRSDAPKPNTRFLRNIVRDVDSHNSALKAREEADARARQRRLRREGQPSKDREEDEEERKKRRRRRNENDGEEGGKARSERHREERKRSRSRSQRHRRAEGRDRERAQSGKHRSRSRSRSPRRNAHRHHDSRSERLQRVDSLPRRHINQRSRSRSASSSTSDPLEELLGPQPLPLNQTLPRGRGAFKPQSSSIETRFREGYDPKQDTRDDDEDRVEDDWDRGLEAVRDRAKWKEHGAGRLRAAGFTEQEVQNWERGPAGGGQEAAREKDIRDVRWMKKGEGVREWDRGKGEDGKADWIGRLNS